ncbi:thymidylate kinase [Serratia phage 92A1]|nr:thymidylate kinase [Serratia phage 92A1]
MANILLIEGPDNAGKTTLINKLSMVNIEQLSFPKRTASGRFTIESRNEVAIFETMLDYLPNDRLFVLDRGYISNIVYGELRAMTPSEKKAVEVYREDFKRLTSNHSVMVLGLTRNKITCDFEDDLISLSDGGFNKVIDLFESEYDRFGIDSIKLLEHDENNKVLRETSYYPELLNEIADYVIKL